MICVGMRDWGLSVCLWDVSMWYRQYNVLKMAEVVRNVWDSCSSLLKAGTTGAAGGGLRAGGLWVSSRDSTNILATCLRFLQVLIPSLTVISQEMKPTFPSDVPKFRDCCVFSLAVFPLVRSFPECCYKLLVFSGTLAFPKKFSCWFKYYGWVSGVSLIEIPRMMLFGKCDVVMLLRSSFTVEHDIVLSGFQILQKGSVCFEQKF